MLSVNLRKKMCEARAINLQSYFLNPYADIHTYEWGRTIWAEIFVVDLLRKVYGGKLIERGFQVMLAQDTLDHSSNTDPIQKGADIIIVDTKNYSKTAIGTGVCGIDVTTGGKSMVRWKLRGRPSFQAQTAIPVLVLPTSRLLAYCGDDGMKVLHHIDDSRNVVTGTGATSVMDGMNGDTFTEWQQGTSYALQEAVGHCYTNLQKNWQASLNAFVYGDHVMRMLKITQSLFQ